MKKIYILSLAITSALLLGGCSASNWNLGKTMDKNQDQQSKTGQQSKTQDKTQSQTQSSNFHIDTIINTWGQPTFERTSPQGNKVYVWENCKPTGVYIDRCDENGCETVPETQCCERALETDQHGYVSNLKEAINSCM